MGRTLQHFPAESSIEDKLAAVERDGAAIVTGVLDHETISSIKEQAEPYIATTPFAKDDFAGRQTQRTGALVARVPACRPVVLHEETLPAARRFLAPYTEKIILHLTQTICIHPGQGAQRLHRDRLAWGDHIPRQIEPQFNTIWALSDFTVENGATRVVPGSHRWDSERRAEPEEICQAEMTAGSVLLYTGSVLHSGGRNQSTTSRLGLNITYCLGWLRQEENQYLSCPPHVARDLEPDLQDLLGYTQGNYALGYYSDPETHTGRYDIMPPEMALGRRPNDRMHKDVTNITEQEI